jgi:L-2-hydroxyglutarate oxidase LhgO
VAWNGAEVRTQRGSFAPGFIVNAAGLHADRLAHDFGFGRDYGILPFKGLYLHCPDPDERLRTHVYPVPDLRFPFLGVHFTRTVGGGSMVGPTALPALWREQYRGVHRFHPGEMIPILWNEAGMFLTNASGFRDLARRELPKFSKRRLLRDARKLVPDAAGDRKWHWGRPGIRAQLQHRPTRELVSDFVIERDERSLHVLNAVSPAFTCALPFAGFIADMIATGTDASRRNASRSGVGDRVSADGPLKKHSRSETLHS